MSRSIGAYDDGKGTEGAVSPGVCPILEGSRIRRRREMRRPTSVELANAFMWLTMLAATVVLLWDSDRLWIMIMVVLISGSTSIGVVAKGCRESR